MNLLEKIQAVANKKESREFQKENEKAREAFKRAQITPIGQIQTRGIITATNDIVGKQVGRPQTEQRPQNLIEELGIKFLSGLTSNFSYPCINGNTSEWVDETEEGNASNAAFSSLQLRPKRLLSFVEYSNEVVLNPNTDVAGAIEEDLINSIWEKVQDTMFNDIFNDDSAMTLSNYNDIVSFELTASQQKISNGIYIVSPIAASKLKTMLNGSMPVYFNGMINGHRVIETPSLEGEKVIFGDWSKLMLGQWGEGLDITVDNVTKQHLAIIKLIINSWWNWGMIDANGFVFATTETNN